MLQAEINEDVGNVGGCHGVSVGEGSGGRNRPPRIAIDYSYN